jgi:DnaJ-class molecular chaperone
LASKCPVCKGNGKVRTGSWWLTGNSDPCTDCGGTGTREGYNTVQARKKV